MTGLNWDALSPEERLVAEQVVSNLRALNQAAAEFRAVGGDVEFTTDGTSVNTTDGWRAMKPGIFVKRDRGEPATPDEWESRDLPRSKVRVALAAIEKSERFGRSWNARRTRSILLNSGWSGIAPLLQQAAKTARDADEAAAIPEVCGYLLPHEQNLHFPTQLAAAKWKAAAKI